MRPPRRRAQRVLRDEALHQSAGVFRTRLTGTPHRQRALALAPIIHSYRLSGCLKPACRRACAGGLPTALVRWNHELEVLFQLRMLFQDQLKDLMGIRYQREITLLRFVIAAKFLMMIDVVANLTDAVDDQLSHVRYRHCFVWFPRKAFFHLLARAATDQHLGQS